MEKEIDIIGIGVSTIDILNIVDHFPDKEEVQRSIESEIAGGGPIATALITAARLGSRTAMIDLIGDDWIGKLIIEDFIKERVITDYIKINSGFTSSIASVLVRKSDGARTIVYSPGNSPEYSAKDIKTDLISKAKFIHMNGRHFGACIKACQTAKENGTLISFDGGSFRYREELRNLVPMTDVCIISKDFAEKYSGKQKINDAADLFLKNGPKMVVITDGINGSWLFTDKINEYHQKAFINPDTKDTTGCGDSFHGAFLFCLCNNYEPKEAVLLASAVAALNSRKLGGRAGLPNLSEVKSFIKNIAR